MIAWTLISPTDLDRLPGLYKTDGRPGDRPRAFLKFFTPDASWTWFAFEADVVAKTPSGDTRQVDYQTWLTLQKRGDLGDAVDVIFFGYVRGQESELGYFVLSELEAARGPLGLPIERDIFCPPTVTLDALKAGAR